MYKIHYSHDLYSYMNDNVYKTDFIAWFNYHYIHGVHGYFGGSCENKKKMFFCDFTLTPSHIPREVPVYRDFKCEGKCEGKVAKDFIG